MQAPTFKKANCTKDDIVALRRGEEISVWNVRGDGRPKSIAHVQSTNYDQTIIWRCNLHILTFGNWQDAKTHLRRRKRGGQ